MAHDKGEPRSRSQRMIIRRTVLQRKASPEDTPARVGEEFVGDAILPHPLQSTKKGIDWRPRAHSPLYNINHCHSWLRLPLLFRDKHHSQNPLQGHGMAAHPPAGEEMTAAIPLTSLVRNGVRIVISPESHLELYKIDPLAFLSVTLGLLYFADHPRIHFYPPRNMLFLKSFTPTLEKQKHQGIDSLSVFSKNQYRALALSQSWRHPTDAG
jgi:hypothetical protein